MILYTPIPIEEILDQKEPEQNITKKTDLIHLPYERGIIELQMISALTAKIIRLHTHVLDDYLNPRLQPGTEIKFNWQKKQ